MPLYGVNLPWLFGSYGHDLAINEHYAHWGYAWDDDDARAILETCRELGFGAVRFWLCEYAEGIVTEGGLVRGVQPSLLDNLEKLQTWARALELKIYPSLLDANSWKREGDELTAAILRDPEQRARFGELVARPIVERLDPELTFGLELLNEPEVMTSECAEEPTLSWETIGAGLAAIAEPIRALRPELRLTAGSMHVFLPGLWGSGAPLDAIDLHLYTKRGGLPPLAHLAEYVGDPEIANMPILAGECGVPDDAPDDPRHPSYYLYNAAVDGYEAVFLWRLEGDLVSKDATRSVTAAGEAVRYALLKDLR